MLTLNIHRPAVAMIELIFAIVIIGISLLSIPNLLRISSDSSLVTIQQEGIAMAAAHTNALMTYAWDEQNTDSIGLYVTKKLHVGASGTVFLSQGGNPTPLTFPLARNRTFAAAGITASVIGTDVNDSNDDVDDFDDVNSSTKKALLAGATYNADEGEYIDLNVSQKTTVTYGSDTATYNSANGQFTFNRPFGNATPASSTNIKLITTRLTSASTEAELQEKDIKLKSFMCNIGANNPKTKGNY